MPPKIPQVSCEPTLEKHLKSRELIYSAQWPFPENLTQETTRHKKMSFLTAPRIPDHIGRGKNWKNTNLVFDELHCRVLKMQLVA